MKSLSRSAPPGSADFDMADDEAPMPKLEGDASLGMAGGGLATEISETPPPDYAAMIKDLEARRQTLEQGELAQLIGLYVSQDREADARSLVEQILADSAHDDTWRLELLDMVGLGQAWMQQAQRTVLARLLAVTVTDELLDRLVNAAGDEDGRRQVAELLIRHCNPKQLGIDRCINLLSSFTAQAGVAEHIAALERQRAEVLLEARRDDMGNVSLIDQYVALLLHQQRKQETLRALSEIVEFAPQDHAARMAYAQRLTQHVGPVAGCAQYATAVQLNPAKRDTFRTMMDLRRSHPQDATALKQCIVDGVSKLPVQRDISLIMFWEDPSADVDMHIHEAPGEHVSYQHKESKPGGLLYYDITNGYGPEIYVLGTAPVGKYHLGVVYYSGSAKDVVGELHVLRHAGAPDEERSVHPFVLPSADKKELPLTTLTF